MSAELCKDPIEKRIASYSICYVVLIPHIIMMLKLFEFRSLLRLVDEFNDQCICRLQVLKSLNAQFNSSTIQPARGTASWLLSSYPLSVAGECTGPSPFC
jgi:hypothetical protein